MEVHEVVWQMSGSLVERFKDVLIHEHEQWLQMDWAGEPKKRIRVDRKMSGSKPLASSK